MSADNFDFTDLRRHWIESAKTERDWRTETDKPLLAALFSAAQALKQDGWREIEYCPKDGSRFLAITPGSTGVFPHYYSGEWPNGSWWCEAHGDLWPSRPILFKPMPKEPK